MSTERPTGPRVIQQFIGQHRVIAQVRVALEATWGSGQPLPHMLLVGPPGLGKTELAHLIGRELGTESRETVGQNLRRPSQVAGFLMQAQHHDVLFIDEVHEIRGPAQTLLYRALADRQLFLNEGPFAGQNACVKLPPFTLLAATTHEAMLAKPLRDRFELVLKFEFYSSAELASILRRWLDAKQILTEAGLAEQVGVRSRGIPRNALRLMRNVHLVARSEGVVSLTDRHFQIACELEGIDALGLDPNERAYLQRLASTAAPLRPCAVAAQLELPLVTVQNVIEPFLLRLGFIERAGGGRRLTERGRTYLAGGVQGVSD